VTVWTLALLSVVLVSLVSLVGLVTVPLDEARVRRLSSALVSFAVGALLGDAFIHLVPEAFADGGDDLGASLLVLAGMLLFFVVEKLLRHPRGPLHLWPHDGEPARRELAAINVIGDAIHNFIDGVLIGASWLAGPVLGLSTTVAVLFHEIPQEIGDFGVLVHSGLPVRKAIRVNLATASVAVAGTLAALLVGSAAGVFVEALVPVAAGGFVYIASADLVPELQHDRSLRGLAVQASLITLGIAVMALLALAE
jgi:zinc and cadmium transporter